MKRQLVAITVVGCLLSMTAHAETLTIYLKDGTVHRIPTDNIERIKFESNGGATKNLSASATISASSEYGQRYSAEMIADGTIGVWDKGEWASKGEKAGAWVLLRWATPKLVSKIVLYDRPNKHDHILQATLLFSDGTTMKTGALPNDGSRKEIDFEPKSVSWIKLLVDEAVGPNIGLSEMEIYGM